MKRLLHPLLLPGLLLLGLAPALATEEKPAIGIVGDPYPLVGQPVQVLISHPSHPQLESFGVSVTYRPNSAAPVRDEIGSPNANGILSWTPRMPGITTLKAVAAGGDKPLELSKNVSVRFEGFPPLGMLIFALAGLTLFGGLGWVLTKTARPGPIQTS